MKKILFIYNNPLDGSYGGSQGTKKAFDGLKRNFDVIPYSCIKKSNKLFTLMRNLQGYSGNLARKDCKKILKMLSSDKFDGVYFDVSLHGRLVQLIKVRFPNVKVIVNYHNCEAQYFRDMFKTKGLFYYPIYHSAVKNELLSKQYADFNVFITEEDRKQLCVESNYCIIPVTLEDSYIESKTKTPTESYLLFVGAAQYANIEGAKYIIEKLAPFTDKKFLIVGKGMKSVFPNDYKNVEIRDFVPSLSEVYQGASAFICPLFYGSGAKVKVAESLMYGKKILGTPLSFFGYEMRKTSFAVCNTEKEFLEEIQLLDMEKCFYEENRQLFLENYDARNNAKYYENIEKKVFKNKFNKI
ncbi:MAG: glycosyltransferase family 4 protein [Treponema sp.]|nr:glycosyltransferase family 4 protein [Treponema sp.]